jgi:sec-independent protein translocase protein TatA
MGSFSVWHWLIVLAIILLLFGGRGKISQLMGDFGKGLNAFKKGVSADPAADANKPATAPATPGDDAKTIGQSATAPASSASSQQAKT